MHQVVLAKDAHLLLPNTYALYALRHNTEKYIYFGSSVRIADRAQQLYYAIAKPDTSRLHEGLRQIAIQTGAVPGDWTLSIMSMEPPVGYDPNAKGDDRPETMLVRSAERQGHGNYVINLMRVMRPDRVKKPRLGPSPIAWLKGRVGLGRRYKDSDIDWAQWELHRHPSVLRLPMREDGHGLHVPVFHPDGMPFAEYLVRIATFAHIAEDTRRIGNVTRAVLEHLFLHWREAQSDPAAKHIPVPLNIRACHQMYRPRAAIVLTDGTIKRPGDPKPEVSDKDFSAEALRDTEDMFAEMGWDPQGRSRG